MCSTTPSTPHVRSLMAHPRQPPLMHPSISRSSSFPKRLSESELQGVPMQVDGVLAQVSLDLAGSEGGLSWAFEMDGCVNLLPGFGQRTESLPLQEIIAAEIKPSSLRRQWCSWLEKAWALTLFTFRRAPSNPSYWHPRQVTLVSTDEVRVFWVMDV